MQSPFEKYDVVKVHVVSNARVQPTVDSERSDDVFLITHNENGTYSWICYQACKDFDQLTDEQIDAGDAELYYDWADATSAEYATVADAIASANDY